MTASNSRIALALMLSLTTLPLSACGTGMSDAEWAEAKRKGEHCVVGGFDDSFVEAVKAQLRDPNSFEHIETRIQPVGQDEKHLIAMRFRSRNGFGGMNEGYAVGNIDHETCAAELTMLQ